MKIDSMSSIERKEFDMLISNNTLENALDRAKSELRTTRFKLLSTIPVCVVGIICLYVAVSLDTDMGIILKFGLTVPMVLLAWFYIKILLKRLNNIRVFSDSMRYKDLCIEFMDFMDMVDKFDVSNFESTYDNEPGGLVVYVENNKEHKEDISKYKVIHVEWVKHQDDVEKYFMLFGDNRMKQIIESKNTERRFVDNDLLNFVAKRN